MEVGIPLPEPEERVSIRETLAWLKTPATCQVMNPLQRRNLPPPGKLYRSFQFLHQDQGRALGREGAPQSILPNESTPLRNWGESGGAQKWKQSGRKRKLQEASTISRLQK